MSEGPAFGLAEIEDEERVIPAENSHLSWGRCTCGARALFDPVSVPRARCGTCLLADAQGAVVPGVPAGWADVPKLGQGNPPPGPARREEFPAPQITSRDCWDGCDTPSAVEKIAAKARAAGWRVKAQRSRGWTPHGTTGRPSAKAKDLYALIFATEDGSASAYAVRDGASWSSVMLWGAELTWFSLASVTDLEDYLAAHGKVSPAWLNGIRLRRASSEERKKLRLRCDVAEHADPRPLDIPGPLRLTACGLCGKDWFTGGDPWRKPKKGREGLS